MEISYVLYARALMTQKSCAAGMRNAKLGNHLNLYTSLDTYILLDVLLCSIAEYFYELCRILASP